MRSLLAFAALATVAAAPAGPIGTWRNGADSVRIRVARCGDGLCGTVVSASAKAKDDAAAGGTERLVGTQLFREFRLGEDGLWHGQVFVPDLDRTFDGTLEQQGGTLVATGCLFAGLGCRSQTWTRVATRAGAKPR